jgi:hypothetical protein
MNLTTLRTFTYEDMKDITDFQFQNYSSYDKHGTTHRLKKINLTVLF